MKTPERYERQRDSDALAGGLGGGNLFLYCRYINGAVNHGKYMYIFFLIGCHRLVELMHEKGRIVSLSIVKGLPVAVAVTRASR